MGTRTTLNMGGEGELDAACRVAFETPWPRTMRKCTNSQKNYAELDSESEEDDQQTGNYPQGKNVTNRVRVPGSKKTNDNNSNDDDDLIIDEKRSTAAPGIRGLATPKKALKTQHVPKQYILRVPLSKPAQQKLRAGKLFKSLPTEVCRLCTYVPVFIISNPTYLHMLSAYFHLHPFICFLLHNLRVCISLSSTTLLSFCFSPKDALSPIAYYL